MTTAVELEALMGTAHFPEFEELIRNVDDVIAELAKTRLWIDWASDTGGEGGHCDFLEGTWKTSPAYFGLCEGPEQLSGNPEHAKLRPLTDQLPRVLPRTTEMLRRIESVNWAGFTRLHAHSNIDLHTHQDDTALTCHLGLVIPPGGTCGLVVEGEVHTWNQPGDLVIFDGTREHGAWNKSDQDRIVLHIDFVKPG